MLTIVKPELAVYVKDKQFEPIKLRGSTGSSPFKPLPVQPSIYARYPSKTYTRLYLGTVASKKRYSVLQVWENKSKLKFKTHCVPYTTLVASRVYEWSRTSWTSSYFWASRSLFKQVHITYAPDFRAFCNLAMYLTVVIDWSSRKAKINHSIYQL